MSKKILEECKVQSLTKQSLVLKQTKGNCPLGSKEIHLSYTETHFDPWIDHGSLGRGLSPTFLDETNFEDPGAFAAQEPSLASDCNHNPLEGNFQKLLL